MVMPSARPLLSARLLERALPPRGLSREFGGICQGRIRGGSGRRRLRDSLSGYRKTCRQPAQGNAQRLAQSRFPMHRCNPPFHPANFS